MDSTSVANSLLVVRPTEYSTVVCGKAAGLNGTAANREDARFRKRPLRGEEEWRADASKQIAKVPVLKTGRYRGKSKRLHTA